MSYAATRDVLCRRGGRARAGPAVSAALKYMQFQVSGRIPGYFFDAFCEDFLKKVKFCWTFVGQGVLKFIWSISLRMLFCVYKTEKYI